MRKLRPVMGAFLVGLALGILCPNLVPKSAVKMNGLSDIVLLQKYLSEPITQRDYFLYLLRQRGVGYLLGAAFGISIFGVPMSLAWMAAMGFYVGAVLASTLLVGGVWGFLLGLGILMPQYLVYIPVSMLFFGLCYQMSVGCWKGEGHTGRDYGNYVLFMLALMLVLLAGFLIESYANPALLKLLMNQLKIF